MAEAAVDLESFLAQFGLTDVPVEQEEGQTTFYVYDGDEVYGDYDSCEDENNYLESYQTGLNQTFVGMSIYCGGYEAYGDVWAMYDSSTGGDDTMTGGFNYAGYSGYIDFYGDAYYMFDASQGGNDHITGGEAANNYLVGDAEYMSDESAGGDDVITGGDAAYYYDQNYNDIYGDAYYMYDAADGGDDTLTGGRNANNYIIGDAEDMGGDGNAEPTALEHETPVAGPTGGDDVIVGGATEGEQNEYQTNNTVYGDAYDMWGNSTGGNDHISGGGVSVNDGYAVAFFQASGDAYYLDDSIGGNDTIVGSSAMASGDGYGESAAFAINLLAGDAMELSDSASGGDDVLVGGNAGVDPTEQEEGEELPEIEVTDDGYGFAITQNIMVGDTFVAWWDWHGDIPTFGNDTMTGGNGYFNEDGYGVALNVMIGDNADTYAENWQSLLGEIMSGGESRSDSSDEGVDTLDHQEEMNPGATYGNDILVGGDGYAVNAMVGDSMLMWEGDTGGNDTLIAGDGYGNMMIGDSVYVDGPVFGGDDTLISGMGDDTMIGDFAQPEWDSEGGADTFVFGMDNGRDTIVDFDSAEDKIDLTALADTISDYFDLVMDGRMVEVGFDVAYTEFPELLDHDSVGTWLYLGEVGDAYRSVFLAGVRAEDLRLDSFVFGTPSEVIEIT